MGGCKGQNTLPGALNPCSFRPLRTAGQPLFSGIPSSGIPTPGIASSLTLSVPVSLSLNKELYPGGDFFPPNGAAYETPARLPLRALEVDYYTHHIGFFCKRELELEKTTHIPLRFRLGSLEQCNYLEGKR